ncbi:5'-adenylylsulfate reductase-like 5 [Wolffia australiana]
MAIHLFYLLFLLPTVFSSSPSECLREEELSFLQPAALPQCSVWLEDLLPVGVSEDTIDRLLKGDGVRKTLYAVLFHAHWCPFSRSTWSAFATLSSIFPDIRHLTIEESAASPSLFSRLGVLSLPAILLINGSTSVRYHGPKDITSLSGFYERAFSQRPKPELSGGLDVEPWRPTGEFLRREPYLAFSLAFLFMRVVVFAISGVLHRLGTAFLAFSRRVAERQVSEMRRICCNLRIRNKHLWRRADNARFWASSLASVSSSS